MMNLFKKAGLTLGSILLGLGMAAGSKNLKADDLSLFDESYGLEQKVEEISKEKKEISAWEYPANIIGGYFIQSFAHENGHAAAALLTGADIEEYSPWPQELDGRMVQGVVWINEEESSDNEIMFHGFAGPLSNIALHETIDYNLRNRNVPEKYQPFLATTALVSRFLTFTNALNSFKYKEGNDFYEVKKGVNDSNFLVDYGPEMIMLYTVFSGKNIFREIRAATGIEYYKYDPDDKKRSELAVLPYKEGLAFKYTVFF